MRRFAPIAIALACLLPAASAAAQPFPEGQQLYHEALAYWNLGEPACSHFEADGQLVNAPIIEELPSLQNGAWGITYWGDAYTGTCHIDVQEGLPPCILKEVVFHETGHLLGLAHSPDPHSVMYERATGLVLCPPQEVKPRRRHFQRSYTVKATA